jgi:prophage regulatory protein
MSDDTNDSGTVYLSASQLAKRYGIHVVTVWRWAQVGRLPKPVRLTPRTTRWLKNEIEACDAERSRDPH